MDITDLWTVVITDDDNREDDHIVAAVGLFPGSDFDAWMDEAERRYPQTETGSLSYTVVKIES